MWPDPEVCSRGRQDSWCRVDWLDSWWVPWPTASLQTAMDVE